jgi:hypothetical protein
MKISTLLILAFISAFFPRVLALLRIPSIVNFAHLIIVPAICLIVISKTKVKSQKQIAIAKEIIFGLFLLFTISFASALLNKTGFINIIINFLIFVEPFILLLAYVSIPISVSRIKRLRYWILGSGFVNLLFSLCQAFLLNLPTGDYVKGVFIGQSAGHVVAASVSLSLGIYFFATYKKLPLWQRLGVLVATLAQIFVSDTKQVLISFVIGFIILTLIKVQDIGKVLLYIIGLTLSISAFVWAVQNIESETLRAYTTWIRPELYGPDGEATRLKFAAVRISAEHFHSPLNWMLGLGPGQTVSRFASMLESYKFLYRFGATTSSVTEEVVRSISASWLGDQSSLFSPLFGWAAIWGDLGFLGLGCYLYLCSIVWRRFCYEDDMSKLLMLAAGVSGCIMTQLEEPGYMLFIVCLIGLGWQERHNQVYSKITVDKNVMSHLKIKMN